MTRKENFTHNIGRSRFATFIAILHRIQKEQKHYGITTNRPFRATVREIVELVDMDDTAVTQALDWFCKQGYLNKRSNDDKYEAGMYKFTPKVINGGRQYTKSLSGNRTLSTLY